LLYSFFSSPFSTPFLHSLAMSTQGAAATTWIAENDQGCLSTALPMKNTVLFYGLS
jgi:hypothetical protein